VSASPPPRVFVSYSHDSEAHRARALGLSDQLRVDLVDARIDRYVQGTPPEGWPTWMHDQIEAADFVLVVCTETYARRALKREEPGRGLGAAWEAGIVTQLVYEDQGRTRKFIPVVFDAGDVAHVPVYLRGATHYRVGDPAEYARLLDHLLGRHATPMLPLGTPRPAVGSSGPEVGSPAPSHAAFSGAGADAGAGAAPLGRRPPPERARGDGARGVGRAPRKLNEPSPPAAPTGPAGPKRGRGTPARNAAGDTADESRGGRAAGVPVVLRFEDGEVAAFRASRIEAGATITLELTSTAPGGAERLHVLQGARGREHWAPEVHVGLAYGAPPTLIAVWARVDAVTHEIADGQTRWRLTVTPAEAGGGMMDEMAVNGLTADDVAGLRARRILLDERAPTRRPGDPRPDAWAGVTGTGGRDSMLELFVSGAMRQTGGGRRPGLSTVERSPLPAAFTAWRRERQGHRTSDAARDRDEFLESVRLIAGLWLILTGTVEQVRRLELAFVEDAGLAVDFVGVRRRVYANRNPAVIEIVGTCPLDGN
jgi:hypothetical protein